MTSPSVSVVIPTCRRAHWLAEALDSVARQRYAPLQVIVVEDGADPDTARVVAEANFPVEHLTIPHCGRPSRVRNRGLARATGDIVAFLDDDDRWEEGKLARQVARFRVHADAPASYTNIRVEHADGRVDESVGPPRRARRLSTRSALVGGCFIYPSTVLARRAALIAAGGFDETLRVNEDYALWLRLSRDGDFVHLDEPLATIRRHGTGQSSAFPTEIWTNTIAVLEAERQAGGLSVSDRLRMRRVLSLALRRLAEALAPAAPERRRYLSRAFRLNPFRHR